jgi:cytochrome P450
MTGADGRRASLADTLRVAGKVVLPTVAGGVIMRRPAAMSLAQKWQTDAAAIATLQRLRARWGSAPLPLRVAGRNVVLLLSPDDVDHVLADSPEPFALASREKVAALGHFQPHGVLVSSGEIRLRRRHVNEAVLQPDRRTHALAPSIVGVVRDETDLVLRHAVHNGRFTWDDFAQGWWRAVRRITLGDAARDDHALINDLAALRADANWAFLRQKRTALRRRFQRRLNAHLDRADDGSLAHALADTHASPDVDSHGQVPHWLFAFEAAGIVTYRALGLLAAHSEHVERAREELAAADLSQPQTLDFLRACALESVRLWPTTPMILRETTTDTTWRGVNHPSGTTVLIYTPFFHRDARTLPYADRFEPDIWLDGRAQANPALVPFSAGPGVCPGRNLVLLVASTVLAAVLEHHDIAPDSSGRLGPEVPATLNHFDLRLKVSRRT